MQQRTPNKIILAAIEQRRLEAKHFRARVQELKANDADPEHIANIQRLIERAEDQSAALRAVLWEIESNIPFVTHQGGAR